LLKGVNDKKRSEWGRINKIFGVVRKRKKLSISKNRY
jgi:hypothetical protein